MLTCQEKARLKELKAERWQFEESPRDLAAWESTENGREYRELLARANPTEGIGDYTRRMQVFNRPPFRDDP